MGAIAPSSTNPSFILAVFKLTIEFSGAQQPWHPTDHAYFAAATIC
jgi:hypothetical protein